MYSVIKWACLISRVYNKEEGRVSNSIYAHANVFRIIKFINLRNPPFIVSVTLLLSGCHVNSVSTSMLLYWHDGGSAFTVGTNGMHAMAPRPRPTSCSRTRAKRPQKD